jgi:histidinol-phosphate phosphatase family protein
VSQLPSVEHSVSPRSTAGAANEHPIVVVTNQSGIGRGYFDEKAHADLTRWMCDRFEAEGAAIARVYHCPYHPLHGIGEHRRDHPWRKPKPGMILQAVSNLRLDAACCVIVGDQMSGIEAGRRPGSACGSCSQRVPASGRRKRLCRSRQALAVALCDDHSRSPSGAFFRLRRLGA